MPPPRTRPRRRSDKRTTKRARSRRRTAGRQRPPPRSRGPRQRPQTPPQGRHGTQIDRGDHDAPRGEPLGDPRVRTPVIAPAADPFDVGLRELTIRTAHEREDAPPVTGRQASLGAAKNARASSAAFAFATTARSRRSHSAGTAASHSPPDHRVNTAGTSPGAASRRA